MSRYNIHIVAFDVPYPANYGGVIDVFNRIKALGNAGIGISLHAFVYKRPEALELMQYCDQVFYYERKLRFRDWLWPEPFIVRSRTNKKLLNNLLRDNNPIIFEGVHCTAFLNHPRLAERRKIVRMHNIEYEYYAQLAKADKKLFTRIYHAVESFKLKSYERVLNTANYLVTISPNDYDHYNARFPYVEMIPSSHTGRTIESLTGYGNYILYHGKLSVPENENAVMYLLKNVFTKINVPFVVAGMQPSKRLLKAAKKLDHVRIVANPSDDIMMNLIKEAQINLLVTFQATGLKLKLLKSLYNGRFCVVNSPMVSGTGLEPLCEIADTPEKILHTIEDLMNANFSEDHIKIRRENLSQMYDPKVNAEKWKRLLF